MPKLIPNDFCSRMNNLLNGRSLPNGSFIHASLSMYSEKQTSADKTLHKALRTKWEDIIQKSAATSTSPNPDVEWFQNDPKKMKLFYTLVMTLNQAGNEYYSYESTKPTQFEEVSLMQLQENITGTLLTNLAQDPDVDQQFPSMFWNNLNSLVNCFDATAGTRVFAYTPVESGHHSELWAFQYFLVNEHDKNNKVVCHITCQAASSAHHYSHTPGLDGKSMMDDDEDSDEDSDMSDIEDDVHGVNMYTVDISSQGEPLPNQLPFIRTQSLDFTPSPNGGFIVTQSPALKPNHSPQTVQFSPMITSTLNQKDPANLQEFTL